ncbi:Uma2 family endonuclease [Synechococcus sp. JA-2-3B'a(2-13)]|uniref:Uma2 family endonuclease n=1 Tax=Synechococcus sp. (strain JA-2-3B'a(2-13)) TaxID=321332 RepID=UPI0002F2D959|nr:Uma2 family endonuclease [Synechococcus sp. JA-2-3B'a(2-13)]
MLSTPELSISGQKLTPEQFLALPEGDIVYELVDGRALSKNEPMSPKRFHARLQPVLWQILEDWCSSPECPKPGSAHTEWAVVLTRKAEPWIPVPDVTYISNERLPVEAMTDEACFAIPELVIEILSPGQSFGAIAQKATDYLEAGIPRVWVVDPQAKSITVFYPDAPPRTFTGSQAIQDDFLPGLKVIPQDVFAQARIP